MTIRPDKDAYFLEMARLVSTRGTCARRLVGCVLVNARSHVMATGYNGVPAGMPHCRGGDCPCEAASAASGSRLDDCEAIHAEANALLQCGDPWTIDTVYCTTAPCKACVKQLLNTSARRIVAGSDYAASGQELWERAGRTWDIAGRRELNWALDHHVSSTGHLGDIMGCTVNMSFDWRGGS